MKVWRVTKVYVGRTMKTFSPVLYFILFIPPPSPSTTITFLPQVGDSVVSKGREILERSIQLVNSHPTWAAQVVYGDTDSLFVHLPGRNRSQAFVIGQEIAAAVTKMYPKPIKLKFEKVYLPCLLQVREKERMRVCLVVDVFHAVISLFCEG